MGGARGLLDVAKAMAAAEGAALIDGATAFVFGALAGIAGRTAAFDIRGGGVSMADMTAGSALGCTASAFTGCVEGCERSPSPCFLASVPDASAPGLALPFASVVRHRRRCMALALVIACSSGWVPASAETPEILVEASQELQKREEDTAKTKSDTAIKVSKDKIFNDPGTPIGGNPKGDVTVVEFFDYQCGYCKMAEPDLEKRAQRRSGVALPAQVPDCGTRQRRLMQRVGPLTLEIADAKIQVSGKTPYFVSMHR